VKKIPIREIYAEVLQQRGFDERGCYGHNCDDACCRYGCDVDKEAYELIVRYGDAIRKEVGKSIAECFEESWSGDGEFLGGDSIESRVYNGFCAFHEKAGKGCVLYRLVVERGLPRRIIPSICRLYPLSWGRGCLFMDDDCEVTCNCLSTDNVSSRPLFETQRREIEDIFDLSETACESVEEDLCK
jgi:hypothetical protein